MRWQLRDPGFRRAIHRAVEQMNGQCALVGTVGVQIHLAAKVGLDKRGPTAGAIELVSLGAEAVAVTNGVVVEVIDPLGFEASVEAGRRSIEIDGEAFPVASPEHILGLLLASDELSVDGKWACFVLMRTFEGKIDLEEARSILKRVDLADRQSLLAELAYLAA